MKAVKITDIEMRMLKASMASYRAHLRKKIQQGKDWPNIHKESTILVNKLNLFQADEYFLVVEKE